MRRSTTRRGITSLEVLLTAIMAAMVGMAVIVLLWTGNHEAMTGEDYMFAEALCQRVLAENMAVPFQSLEEEKLPLEIPVEGLPPEDATIAQFRPEYAMNLEGACSFKGQLVIDEVEPDSGLYRYRVVVTWPVRPGATTMRRYVLLRYRCRKDVALSTNFVIETEKDVPVSHNVIIQPEKKGGT